jgi:hypothetical protein
MEPKKLSIKKLIKRRKKKKILPLFKPFSSAVCKPGGLQRRHINLIKKQKTKRRNRVMRLLA